MTYLYQRYLRLKDIANDASHSVASLMLHHRETRTRLIHLRGLGASWEPERMGLRRSAKILVESIDAALDAWQLARRATDRARDYWFAGEVDLGCETLDGRGLLRTFRYLAHARLTVAGGAR